MARLLLIDDREENLLTFSAVLEDEGYEVDAGASIAEARARLALPGARYDLALIDLALGDGNGAELVPVLRSNHPATRIVMMSGSSQVDQALTVDVDGWFEKGMGCGRLLDVLRATLGGRP
jgi:DNA-binding NtrC family response regulator